MIDDPDVWRAATLLLKRHGSDAARMAAKLAEELAAAGDLEGHVVWKHILEAVAEIERTTPAEGQRVN